MGKSKKDLINKYCNEKFKLPLKKRLQSALNMQVNELNCYKKKIWVQI